MDEEKNYVKWLVKDLFYHLFCNKLVLSQNLVLLFKIQRIFLQYTSKKIRGKLQKY